MEFFVELLVVFHARVRVGISRRHIRADGRDAPEQLDSASGRPADGAFDLLRYVGNIMMLKTVECLRLN